MIILISMNNGDYFKFEITEIEEELLKEINKQK